jgi:DNA-binding PadR family transcriptional regulator
LPEDRQAQTEEYSVRGWQGRHGKPGAGDRAEERGSQQIHGRGRGKRLFGHGDIRFVLLSLLSEKPSYGYELIKAIEERLSGAYVPSPGLVYPTLTLLEEMGYISTETSGEGKKLHSVTPQGKAFLKVSKPVVEKIFDRMSVAAECHKRSENPQLVRAIENLKLALKLKSSAGELTQEQIRTIASTLDEAARTIEAC